MELICCLCQQPRESCAQFSFIDKDWNIDSRNICSDCAKRFGWYCNESHAIPAEMLTFLDGGQKTCPICIESRVKADFIPSSTEKRRVYLAVRAVIDDKVLLDTYLSWVKSAVEEKYPKDVYFWIAVELTVARYNITPEKVIDEIKKRRDISILLPANNFPAKS